MKGSLVGVLILGTILIVISGLYFTFPLYQGVLINLKQYIYDINVSFFANMPGEALFLFTFLIFMLVLGFILRKFM